MLKPRNTAVNVITAIFAALMSVLLVVLLFATATLGTVNSLTTPQGLGNVVSDVIQNVDFEQILIDSAEDMDISEEDLQEAQIISRLLETDAAEEVIDLFCTGITATISGDEDTLVTDTQLRTIVHENADEIVDILYEIDPSVDRETIRDEMLTYVDENAAEMINSLMDGVTESIGSAPDIAPVLNMFKIAFIIMVVLCLLLAGGIYGCRWYRFGGFLWVGIDAAITGALTAVIALVAKSNLLTSMIPAESITIVTAATSGIGDHFMRTAILLFGLGVLLIGLFILLKCTVVNPRVKAAQAAELPVTEA